jgi:hypothetical protein
LLAALSVAIEEPRDPELRRVIENQLADLPVALVDDVATASITVVLREVSAGYEIQVSDRRSGQTHVRHAHAARKDRRLKLSALREATALAIRGTVQALVAGETVPEDIPELAAEPELRPDPEPLSEPEEEKSIWNSRRLYLGAGWGAGPGKDDVFLDQGPLVTAGFAFHGFEAGLQLGVVLPMTFRDEFTEITLSRKRAAGLFGRTLVTRDSFTLLVTVSGGIVHTVRKVTGIAQDVAVTPSNSQVEPFAGFDFRFRLFSPLMFEVSAGGEFYPKAPILRYVRDGQIIERVALSTFQPRIGLAILFLTP